jgi:sugar phosphate isomerase/epimerase
LLRLAVCSWSLHPADPRELLDRLQAIGIPRVQLALDPLRERPSVWGAVAQLCRDANIEIVSGMCACVGEDYSTLETIRATGGIVPDATWDENRARMDAAAAIAAHLGLTLVTFHAGFLPHDPGDPAYAKLQARVRELADRFAVRNLSLALETGQETATSLRQFLSDLQRSNVGVNFDPANLILYDKGDPIQALQTLAPWIRQIHIKDARRTQQPGTWGEEVRVGSGEVDWKAFLARLERIGFTGNCCIEREAGPQREAEIRTAREYLEQILA